MTTLRINELFYSIQGEGGRAGEPSIFIRLSGCDLACGIAWAISTRSEQVAYAAHAGDHAIYPDCRDEFASALNTAALLADWHQVRLERPFVRMSKADIVRRGNELEVPFAMTWSCYEGADVHCGKCGTCHERREAFALAGVNDPTHYA